MGTDNKGTCVYSFESIKEFSSKVISSTYIQQIFGTYSTRILLIVLGLVSSVILARGLGPEKLGLLSAAVAFAQILSQFSNCGLSTSNTFYLGKDRNLLSTLMANSFLVGVLLGSFISLIVGILFLIKPAWAPVHGSLLLIALLWVPLNLVNIYSENFLLSLKEVQKYNVINIGQKLLYVSFLVLLWFHYYLSPELIFIFHLVNLLIGLLWAVYYLIPELNQVPTPSASTLKESLTYGFKAYLAGVFSFLVLRIDLLMIKYLIGDTPTGQYHITVKIANMLFLLPTVVSQIMFPTLTNEEDMEKMWSLTCKTAMSVGVLMLSMFAGVYLFGEFFIELLYGRTYLPAYVPLVIMGFGVVIWGIETTFRTYLNADPEKGFRIEIVYIWSLTLPLNLILNYYFITKMGITGAGLASAISLSLVGLLVGVLVVKDRREKNNR